MLKKRYIAMLMIVLSLVLTACGGKTEESDTKDDSTPYPSVTSAQENMASDNTNELENEDSSGEKDDKDDLIKVGFAQVGHESDWRTASTASAQDVFSESNGYNLLFADADNNPEAQIDVVREFIEQKVDYLVIDPVLPTGWDEVLGEAKEAGIPVFIIDRMIDADESLYVAWYGSDFEAEGKAAAAWLKAYIKKKGIEDEALRIVTITGNKGSSAQIGRSKGFKQIAEKEAGWELLGEKDGEFTEDGGYDVMRSFLKAYDDIDVVVCQNDNEAWGAMRALEAEGLTYGINGRIIIISFDAVRDGLADVMAGKINADFECNPLAAPYVAEAIQIMEAGCEIGDKINYIEESCFQSEAYVDAIEVDGKVIEMITMTDEVLANRVY